MNWGGQSKLAHADPAAVIGETEGGMHLSLDAVPEVAHIGLQANPLRATHQHGLLTNPNRPLVAHHQAASQLIQNVRTARSRCLGCLNGLSRRCSSFGTIGRAPIEQVKLGGQNHRLAQVAKSPVQPPIATPHFARRNSHRRRRVGVTNATVREFHDLRLQMNDSFYILYYKLRF
jgi:hypothetical protein